MGKSLLVRAYAEYMNWGGLPESAGLPVKRNYLSSVFQKIYLGDICARNKISNPAILRLMVKKISESIKQPISYSRIAKVLAGMGGKISVPTISSYISFCEDAWLIFRVHNICAAFSERESVCKYYFVDNGLISLMLVDATTTLLENAVAVSLFRRYGHDEDNERVFFYHQNVEVDFYIPEDELAIQVSYAVTTSEETCRREVDALHKLPKALACKHRLIITYDEEGTIEDEYGTIHILPCWKWLLNCQQYPA